MMVLALAAAAMISCRGDLPSLTPPRQSAVEPHEAARTSAKASLRPAKPEVVGVLNLNRATEAELRLLPGIGKGRAQAIVARRAQRPFESLDEVARIRGLKGVLRRLRSHLVLSGDTTLRAPTRTEKTEQAAAASVGAPAG
jgi:competence protein ComEA